MYIAVLHKYEATDHIGEYCKEIFMHAYGLQIETKESIHTVWSLTMY